MKAIALIGVVGVLLVDLTGAIAGSSVGGPLTLLLLFLLAMLATGIHEARVRRRGVAGSIVSIVCALAGGVLAVVLGGMLMEAALPHLDLEGPLATSQHPVRYIAPAGLMLLTLAGSWLALQIVNLVR